jgi:hypothetical protein
MAIDRVQRQTVRASYLPPSTHENSSTRNRNNVRLAELFNIWISRPSLMPYGCGLISVGRVGSFLVLRIKRDTAKNQPDIHKKKQLKWNRPHGTLVEMEMEGHYQKGPHSIEAYLQQTAIANPHVSIAYDSPQGKQIRHCLACSSVASPKRPPVQPC